nr:unnamed protein product [Digitaria exilis]
MDEAATAAALAAARGRWTQWEEVVMSNDRGRRLVHYYLRGDGEAKELAVVGRERSPRHMSYAVQGRFLRALAAAAGAVAPSPSRSPSAAAGGAGADGGGPRRWRSRREVVDWLSSLVSGCSYGYSTANRWSGNSYDDNDINCTQVTSSKDVSSREISKDFTWLGSAWHCQQRLKHYKSFCRRGITISVHSFVYIMSEEMKRLIAYVEDLYEDANSYNMVKVRWFDKVDEIGGPLPMDVDDREIFFSLGCQDLNVECIDGLAAVLSAEHYEKFKNGTRYSLWQPYLCRRQIDDDEVKPFDVTELQGYWNQEVLRTMFNAASSLKVRFKVPKFGPSSDGALKRKRDAFDDGVNQQKFLGDKHLYPGCQVEILSQDSGIRGCWFRCLILKRHNDKIKVRYLELQDVDETGNLEEWVMLTRVAKPDQLGIRFLGRPMVRPHVEESKASCFVVGSIVDAWWHGGWWEGIVLRQADSGRLQVYFPGEKRVAEFLEDDLRHSLEWIGNKWNPLKERKDITNKLTSTADCGSEDLIRKQIPLDFNMSLKPEPLLERGDEKSSVSKISRDNKRVFADLTNALKLDNLRWMPRKRSRRSASRRQSDSSGSSSGEMDLSSPSGSSGQLNSIPDEETCKSSGEQRLHVPNLVMSR